MIKKRPDLKLVVSNPAPVVTLPVATPPSLNPPAPGSVGSGPRSLSPEDEAKANRCQPWPEDEAPDEGDVVLPDGSILFSDGARGRYIPQHFAEEVDRQCVTGVSGSEFYVLRVGPDHPEYWDTWERVMQNAVLTDEHGIKYTLHQDGDLWMVPLK